MLIAYYNIGMLIAYPYRWYTIITKTNCRLFPVNLYQYIGQTPNTLRSHQIASQVICHQYSRVDTSRCLWYSRTRSLCSSLISHPTNGRWHLNR